MAWEADMPWREVSLMDQRKEFIRLFGQADVNRRELCRRFGISPKTAYKWLERYEHEGRRESESCTVSGRSPPSNSTYD